MELDSGWQQALLAEIRAATAEDPRVIAVQAYGSVASGRADAWSDLDVAVRVVAGAAGAVADPRWLSRFGRVWASDATANSSRTVMRVVYADGRRLDLTVADAGRRVGTPLAPALDRLAARTTRVRFAAALAVVKAVRGDLLLATHLTLGLLRDCLELALALRDRRTGVVDEVPARIAALIRAAGDAGAILDALAGVAKLYDELASAQDARYQPDWSGLEALLARAR
jgi:hypothetical protein